MYASGNAASGNGVSIRYLIGEYDTSGSKSNSVDVIIKQRESERVKKVERVGEREREREREREMMMS